MNIVRNITKLFVFLFLVNGAFLNNASAMMNGSGGMQESAQNQVSLKKKVTKCLQEFLNDSCFDCPKIMQKAKNCCGEVGVKSCSCIACCGCFTAITGLGTLLYCYFTGDGTGICHPYRIETLFGLTGAGTVGGGIGVFFSNKFDKWRPRKTDSRRQAEAQEGMVKEQQKQTLVMKQIADGIGKLKED